MPLFNVREAIEIAVQKSRKLKEGILRAYWCEVVGKLSTKTEPLFIKNSLLYVAVEDSLYLHHMSMNKNRYLVKIAQILKSNDIKDIRFKVSDVKELISNRKQRDNFKELKNNEVERWDNSKSELENLTLKQKIEVLKRLSVEREKRLLNNGYRKCSNCGVLFEGEGKRCKHCSMEKRIVLEDRYDNK